MKAHTASLLNAVILILCSVWAYWTISGASLTALIPAACGIALLACYSGVKAENKILAHIAAVLTLLVLIALYMPLMSALGSGNIARIARSGLMTLSTIVAMFYFIKSFRDARRERISA